MVSNYNLSEGALQVIMNGGDVVDPIMQVLGSKKIINATGHREKERYRLLLSDGKYNISFAMLTTQFNDKIEGGVVQNYSIIKLKRYITSLVNNTNKGETRILLILDLELIVRGDLVGCILGAPVQLIEEKNCGMMNTQSSSNSLIVATPTNIHPNSNHFSLANTQIISPISSLNPFHNNWVIKARVFNKTNIRTWANSRSEGQLFSIDLLDNSGEIRCTAFREMVDKYFNYFEVDKIYYLSKCSLKPCNRIFCPLKSEYEMTLTSESIVEECLDNSGGIPQISYDFTTIDKIAAMEVGTLVDLNAVCKSASDIQIFTSKTTNRELHKREILLIDQSKTGISLILWGSQAETFDGSTNPVVVIKGGKVGEFGGGKNLSLPIGAQIKINPDIVESYRIRNWYDTEGNHIEIKNISERCGLGNFNSTWMSFKEAQDSDFGLSEKGDYYQNLATILFIKSDNAVYKACPSNECNKKVTDLQNGMYRCEKCNREYSNFKYRLLAFMNLADSFSSQWVTLFSSEAEKILGKSSQEIGEIINSNPDYAFRLFEEIHFKQFVFKCRTKVETFNDEQRLKTVVVKVDPVNYPDFSSHLVEKIYNFLAAKNA